MPKARSKKRSSGQSAGSGKKSTPKRAAAGKKKGGRGASKVGRGASKVGRGASKAGGKKSPAEDAEAAKRMSLIIRAKFKAAGNRKPTNLEKSICQYLVEMESSDQSSKTFKALRQLGIVSAYPYSVNDTKKAILIFVPYAQHKEWKKIQERVQGELQKKFSGQDVVFLAQRKVIRLNQIRNNVPRPRNQTITQVQDALLEDLVYPTKIVGKRMRYQTGGNRFLKVYLDPKQSKEVEPRLKTFATVYRKLTKKKVKFLFPRYVV